MTSNTGTASDGANAAALPWYLGPCLLLTLAPVLTIILFSVFERFLGNNVESAMLGLIGRPAALSVA